MERPLSPAEAAKTLWEIEQAMDAEVEDLVALRRGYADLVKAHRLEFARAFLSARGNVEERKRQAEEATIELFYAVQSHEQQMEACRDKLRVLRERSEIGRAINSNLKEEMRNV